MARYVQNRFIKEINGILGRAKDMFMQYGNECKLYYTNCISSQQVLRLSRLDGENEFSPSPYRSTVEILLLPESP